MKIPALPLVCLLGLSLTPLHAKPLDIVGEDDASNSEYNTGWADNKGDGTGFAKWTLRATTDGTAANSHAGFYIASSGEKTDLNGVAMRGKAFGMYANGTAFEEAVAFRNFSTPLKVGQSFSFMMEHGEIVKKFDTDATGSGSLGLTLRATTTAGNTGDYNNGVRFEIGYYQDAKGYVLYDNDGMKKLDIPFTDAGLAFTFTLATADTYNLEITTLADHKTTKLTGRKLGGTAGAPLTSFCVFDRNGETNDVYFNGFQILQPAQ